MENTAKNVNRGLSDLPFASGLLLDDLVHLIPKRLGHNAGAFDLALFALRFEFAFPWPNLAVLVKAVCPLGGWLGEQPGNRHILPSCAAARAVSRIVQELGHFAFAAMFKKELERFAANRCFVLVENELAVNPPEAVWRAAIDRFAHFGARYD